ncbi:MAG: TetR/AcrR family transcriptional regulator [Acidimicrobiales bacterium]
MTDRRLTPRGRERRRQLMDYATERFAEHGYDPTSVSEIVDGLGVGKGVFYWYFDSKESLLHEILTEAQHRLRRCQREAIGAETDPLRRIELGIRATISWQAEHPPLVKLAQFAAGEDRFAPTLRQAHDVALADVVGLVKDAIISGQVRDDDPQMLAHAILGVTVHLSIMLRHEHGPDAGELADLAVRFCLDGLTV